MRRWTAVAALLVLQACAAGARPVCHLPERYVQAGEIREAFWERDIRVVNRGDAPLVLWELESGCDSCLSAGILDREIAPGATGRLHVAFSTATRSGPFEVHLAVRTNDPSNQTAVLTVAGTAAADYEVVPPVLAIQPASVGEALQGAVRVRALRPPGAAPDRVSCAWTQVTARVRSGFFPYTYEVDVAIAPPLPAAGTNLVLRLATGRAEDPECVLRVVLEAPRPYSVQPGSLEYAASDAEQMRIVLVRQTGAAPFAVLDAVPPGPQFTCEIVREAGLPNYRVNVYSRGVGGLAGRVGDVVIRTDRPADADFRVPVWVRPAGGEGGESRP